MVSVIAVTVFFGVEGSFAILVRTLLRFPFGFRVAHWYCGTLICLL